MCAIPDQKLPAKLQRSTPRVPPIQVLTLSAALQPTLFPPKAEKRNVHGGLQITLLSPRILIGF